ncbi:dihydrolipoyl dehydrogenase family protein [Lacticaseibacillus baoqingensis]|uniref:Dihydrolipoyl dehydrogenase family protein n=1 Tax=Lacticaseibacillus baoqingensis TaxID=2486013 RepID=A0ABW4E868_9LACO|nr:NAD(P)/FAD-dependent oxidoreductase [Lacticaseibacillus baoqingensis]
MEDYDVIVIGGGPAGLAAANTLAAAKRVLMFENDLWGGTCPNRGCDPKKMLYHAAEVRDAAIRMGSSGLVGAPDINWPKLMAFKRHYTQNVPGGTETGLRAAGITTRHGQPELVDNHTVRFEGATYKAADIIIATGRKPAELRLPGSELLKTSADFLDLDQLPQTIIFIGAGYVSMELANIAATAGATVHVINRSQRALRAWDETSVAILKAAMVTKHIHFHEDVTLEAIEPACGKNIRLLGRNGFNLEAPLVINATGRVPVAGLPLRQLGIAASAAGIKVDGHMQTSIPHIYAVGDVVAKDQPKLTPVASFEGRYVGQHLLGATDPIVYPAQPEIVFGATELAKVGVDLMTAEQEPNRYMIRDQDVTHWYTYNRIKENAARVVTITDKTTQHLAGAVVVSSHAEELINQFTLLIDRPLATVNELIYGYPTMASDLPYFL